MTPTTIAVSKFQKRHRERYMRRLELPGDREPSIVRPLVAFVVAIALLFALDAVTR